MCTFFFDDVTDYSWNIDYRFVVIQDGVGVMKAIARMLKSCKKCQWSYLVYKEVSLPIPERDFHMLVTSMYSLFKAFFEIRLHFIIFISGIFWTYFQ